MLRRERARLWEVGDDRAATRVGDGRPISAALSSKVASAVGNESVSAGGGLPGPARRREHTGCCAPGVCGAGGPGLLGGSGRVRTRLGSGRFVGCEEQVGERAPGQRWSRASSAAVSTWCSAGLTLPSGTSELHHDMQFATVVECQHLQWKAGRTPLTTTSTYCGAVGVTVPRKFAAAVGSSRRSRAAVSAL